MRALIMLQILLLGVICSISSAEIIHIPRDFETIQAGIDEAEEGDTVLVQPGRYVENIIFRGTEITVASLLIFGGGQGFIDSTIIDGDRNGSVVSFMNGEDSTAVLMGFTITNGTGRPDWTGDLGGGGVYCVRSSPTLSYLKVTGNRARYGGGLIFEGSTARVSHLEVIGNHATRMGGGIYFSHNNVNPSVEQTLIVHNTTDYMGGGLVIYNGDTRLSNVTIADNDSQGVYFILCRAELKNCIIWDNRVLGYVGEEGGASPVSFSYTDISGAGGRISGCNVTWNEGNIDEDPQFVDPANDNYLLAEDSPCIDAGDPNDEGDPDGSRADMGWGLFSRPYFNFAEVAGQVIASDTRLPIPFGAVSISEERSGFGIIVNTDSSGYWHADYLPLFDTLCHYNFDAIAAGYLNCRVEAEIVNGDSIWIEIRMDHSELSTSCDSLSLQTNQGGSAQASFSIRNDGNGPLTWTAKTRSTNDVGYEPWNVRQMISVSQITNDSRIEGAIFDGESYFCAGANGEDPNLIYQITPEGVVLRSFPQPGHSRFGFKDMEWDGDLIWGSGEDTVFAINRDGEVIHSWAAPSDPTNNIAYDPVDEILWLSGTTTDIKAYDRGGNYLDRTLDRQGLRLYGLAWFADDPDSACLYGLNVPGEDTTQIHKYNTSTGETSLVATIPLDSTSRLNNAFICRNFDQYRGWVLMTIANFDPNSGGDQLRVLQLQPNNDWLTIEPDSGEVPAGEEVPLDVTLYTTGGNQDWVFEPGEYEGEIVFTHDGQGGQTILPVYMTVVEPDGVGGRDGYGDPSSFELFAPYPNPFNSRTTIRFRLDKSTPVSLKLYNLTGEEVARLFEGDLQPGIHSTEVDAVDLPSGLYFARLTSAKDIRTLKLMLMK